MKKNLKIALVLAFLVAIWTTIFPRRNTDVHTSMFCAYGKMFVEFREENHVWGTLWLDNEGRPILCTDTEKITEKYIQS
jgi:hypothetical protein